MQYDILYGQYHPEYYCKEGCVEYKIEIKLFIPFQFVIYIK